MTWIKRALFIVGGFMIGWTCSSRNSELLPTLQFQGDAGRRPSFREVAVCLTFAEPATDVERALALGDRRYIAIGAPGLMTPGVDVAQEIKILPYVNDRVVSFADQQINRLVTDYAKAYNVCLHQRLAKTSAAEVSKD